MDPAEPYPLALVIVEHDPGFTLSSLARACGSEREALVALVEAGVLDPSGADPQSWRFPAPALRTARTAVRLLRDLEMDPADVALVLGLLARIERLEAQLRRSGLR